MRQILYITLFVCCSFLQSCNNTNKLAKHSGSNIYTEPLDAGNSLYSSDSTYIVHIINPSEDHHVVPLIFAVTEKYSNDTVLFSNKEYNLAKWKNDSILILTKIRGVNYSNAKSKLNTYSSNLIEKYFNCKSGVFLPVNINKNQNEK